MSCPSFAADARDSSLVIVAAAVIAAALSGDTRPPVAPFTLTSDAGGDITLAPTGGAAAGRSRPVYRHSVIPGDAYSARS
jgi:hypothetical protein